MLLNCIILGATMLFVFYKADKLDVVDEGYDENKQNRQGAIGWFIASIFVGVLALPVMVLREVYQWKRYKLPSIEWDDICRYGFAITFRTHDSIYVESYMVGDAIYKTKSVYKWRDRVSMKTDTIYKSILRADSIPVPVPIERKATWWERTQMFVGKIAVGAVVLCLISLLLWLIHRKR